MPKSEMGEEWNWRRVRRWVGVEEEDEEEEGMKVVVYISERREMQQATRFGRRYPSRQILLNIFNRTLGDAAEGHHFWDPISVFWIGSPRRMRFAAEPLGKTVAEVPGLGELMMVWVRPGLMGLSGWKWLDSKRQARKG